MAGLPIKGVVYELNTFQSRQGPTPYGRQNPCANMELNLHECMEAYGVLQGYTKCEKYLEDFHECTAGAIKKYRFKLMKRERYKQILTGQRPFEQRYGQPYAYDSFVYGTFYP